MVVLFVLLVKGPFEVEPLLNYNHKFPPCHRVVESNYLETYKTTKDDDIY